MPLITDIRRQQKRADRYAVYIDERYAFSLPDLELSGSGLRIGQELSDGEVADWVRQAGEGKAYDLALKYLSYRMRSEREIGDYLARKGYGAEAGRVVERLRDMRLLDDRAFAAAWVAERQTLRSRSKRMLEQELMQKGVAREVIQGVLAEMSVEEQDKTLDDLIARKRRLSQYQDQEKLMAYLARQGFTYEQIKKALVRLDD